MNSLNLGFVEILEVVGAYWQGKPPWINCLHNHSHYGIIVDVTYELVMGESIIVLFSLEKSIDLGKKSYFIIKGDGAQLHVESRYIPHISWLHW